MAVTACINGHRMWNGDGKPIIWAFKISDLRKYEETFPDKVLSFGREFNDLQQMYDCITDIDGEELDCWFCDECKSLAVFTDQYRFDYVLMQELPKATYDDVLDWDFYIALRNIEFEEFQDFYEGKRPLEAIFSYDFKYLYKVSPDKSLIYAFDRNDKLAFTYKNVRKLFFDKE